MTYHIGADYIHDPDGTMVCQPKKVRLSNTEPSKGHPELDTTDILEGQQVNHYLAMVGLFQWLIALGRFDLQAQVISISRFRAQPRQGSMHCHKNKRLCKKFRTIEPDFSYPPEQNFNWAHTVYGHVQEIIPNDIPDPLGKAVTATTTVDANLNHCLDTGRSLTSCLHFVNYTPIDSYSKVKPQGKLL